MKRGLPIVAVIVVVALVIGSMSVYTVRETEKAIKFRLGEIVDAKVAPGLHFKTPFVNNVRYFDARVQTLDQDPQRFLTQEKKNLIVDAFVKWRIGDVRAFYTTVQGSVQAANTRLSEIIQEGLRNEFGSRTIREIISGDRVQITRILQKRASEAAKSLGVDVVDVRLKRVDLPDSVSESVYQRMAAERERVAREFRAEGAEAAERIRASADRQRTVILAKARRDADRIRGAGDAEAARIYAGTYSDNPEFYAFYRSLQSYKRSLDGQGDVVVLSPDSEYFRYFRQPGGGVQSSGDAQSGGSAGGGDG
ncbi:Modulator of FtsH protease HflC [wastewater metagenome]|uniref:Modulator of FtsH protease HflC n=2 Tax=unclassified sequences TaxID=12908 RepID=A0A5B8RD58_9ZZZZ|nr:MULTISPECIES: protease modulator HflC [Arhodomonas]MCS4505157.1 protease modulator HflC [Arhodomonas aquaeolei]QEA05424.1 modulator of FtsH protease HflC [uncultured organism]